MLEIISPAVDTPAVKVVKPFEKRQIKYVFHNIDGTHSLIRDRMPVMTLVTGSMAEEVAAPGYETGHGKLIEKFCGSTWQKKNDESGNHASTLHG